MRSPPTPNAPPARSRPRQPFTRTTRRSVPTPPLRIRIACEVSGSMVEFAGTVASAAWILAHACGCQKSGLGR